MKRSASDETIENPLIEAQEVLKKARHDEHSPTPAQTNNVDQQTDEVYSTESTNGDNGVEDTNLHVQNGHNETNGQQNGFNTEDILNGATNSHEEISVNGAFDLEHVPEQFMAEDVSETETFLLDPVATPVEVEVHETELQVSQEEGKDDDSKKLPIEKLSEPESAPVDLDAGSSSSEGWDQRELYTWTMKGHTDAITAVAIDGNMLVTASSDTTVRVWDTDSQVELCSLGGHTAGVTSVCLLSITESRELIDKMKPEDETEEIKGRIVLSGSSDCNVKIWLAPQGELLKSIYTFNGVVRVGYMGDGAIVTATDGGKLEMFNAVTGNQLSSIKAFELPIAALKVSGGMIICGDAHGNLQAWQVRDNHLRCLRNTNVIEMEHNTLAALDFSGNCAITGHLSGNLKSISWTTGVVKKFRPACIGRVDDLVVDNELLVTSTSNAEMYALHFYELPQGKYLGSVQSETRMNTVGVTRCGRGWRIITGGEQLQVWETQCKDSNRDGQTARVTLWPQPEEADSDSEDETDGEGETPRQNRRSSCNIL